MGRNLVIVESPAKARTLNKHLGKDFDVKASVGHIRDLPKQSFGVDIESDFEPQYQVIRGKGKVLTEIKKAARKAEKVFLAPDPDREGEAIAWHIAQELDKGSEERIFRVVFHELTGPAIKKAFSSPGKLDLKKVDAQQARRVLDRIVGYELSPLLWKKVRRGLSAGRVQSVTLRLICEREKAIGEFIKEEYWSLTASLEGSSPPPFTAKLDRIGGEKAKITGEEQANELFTRLGGAEYRVASVERKKKSRRPVPPFITSHLQQEAYRRLRFTAKRTMRIAQQLYEGLELGKQGSVGLITYMRTDSPRVAAEAQDEARGLITSQYGPEYLPDKPPQYKGRKSAQEAHEAIRPTSVEILPAEAGKYLDKDQAALYRLIWQRFVASQMKPARYDQTGVDIEALECTFRATGSIMTFPGFTRVYEETPEENGKGQNGSEGGGGSGSLLPPLEKGQVLDLRELLPKQHFTQPPPRFTEATLVRELEEKGIGRPSTYAAILSTIQHRDYTNKVKRNFHPTDLGMLVNDLLVKHFPEVLDVTFTAAMEDHLDRIEEGREKWRSTLKDFYVRFAADMSDAKEKMVNIKAEIVDTDIDCDSCSRKMVIRWGKNGRFLACSGYPECKSTRNFREEEDGTIVPIEKPPDEETSKICDKCGSPLVIKTGRFGKFLACSSYPKCTNTMPLEEGLPCAVEGCSGTLKARLSKRKRRFFSCSRYPDCKFAVWDRPVEKPCPQCGSPIVTEKRSREGTSLICPRPDCGWREQQEEEE